MKPITKEERNYIVFSAINEDTLEETRIRCESVLGAPLSFHDFCAFFKISQFGEFDIHKMSGLSYKQGMIYTQSGTNVSITCGESDVNMLQGYFERDLAFNVEDTIEIVYDLTDIRQSVSEFIRVTQLPEFLFWKTILEPNSCIMANYFTYLHT
jgi:hypothetical protein